MNNTYICQHLTSQTYLKLQHIFHSFILAIQPFVIQQKKYYQSPAEENEELKLYNNNNSIIQRRWLFKLSKVTTLRHSISTWNRESKIICLTWKKNGIIYEAHALLHSYRNINSILKLYSNESCLPRKRCIKQEDVSNFYIVPGFTS